jgi:hypothetical protein
MNKLPDPTFDDLEQISVDSAESLTRTLLDNDVDTELWGHPPYKSIDRLYEELDAGESRLVQLGSTIGRLVSVVNVEVTAHINGMQYNLKEDRQEFADGNVRRRDLPGVSEKIQGNEDPEAAARRGIAEELGVTFAGALTSALSEVVQRPSSHSYPNLSGIYLTHLFKAEFSEAEWNPDGYKEVQPDKTTYFVWKQV